MEFKILNDINDDIVKIRTDTFVIGRNVPKEIDFDGRDNELLHFCLYDEKNLTAYLRAEEMGDKIHIGRVCVEENDRKKGYGKMLLNYLFEYAKNGGFAMVELSAVDTAVGFYKKLGFIAEGEFFMEAGAPHINMYRQL